VVCWPFAVLAPVTEKLTLTPLTRFWKASATVAVTQCWTPAVVVAVSGDRARVAGAAAS
jgi:hypothetical protein